MLRRAWKPIAGGVAVAGAASYLSYRYYGNNALKRPTFDIQVRARGSDGKPTMAKHTLLMLTKEEVNARLNEHAVGTSTKRPGGIVWKQTTAFLPSNDPIEDANACAIVEGAASDGSPAGDLLFFAVMDGHSGFHTSRLLSKVLIPAVAMELLALANDPNSRKADSSSATQYAKSLFSSGSTPPIPLNTDPKYVALAIQNAFTNLDSELVNAPIRILAQELGKEGLSKDKPIPDLSNHPMGLASMQPALSGSCAIMALIDTAHQDLYVACTGDSRAVAGVYEETEDGKGSWRVEVLSEDQTGRNPNEKQRIQSEHPPDEAEDVIKAGRVLGHLEPTRAFGDARYKWPREVIYALSKAFMEGNDKPLRPSPPYFKTPPYVTARPEVTHRKLSLPTATSLPASKSSLRFIVLATDGLWDELSSEEVVALVGGHLAGLKGAIPKSALPALVPTTTGSQGVQGKEIRSNKANNDGAWAFVDDNVSTHLIRNAFGGADEQRLSKLLSIPAPISRRFRDDVTVTVVWWEDGREQDAKAAALRTEQVKAKL